jgi:glycosyltransferase involved in cell wall biosynthesis
MAARTLDILYVGTLPPHTGGSAIQSANVLAGLARRGHRVRALAQITSTALAGGDRFAARHPELGVVRMTLPFLDVSPDFAKEEYTDYEGRQVERLAPALLAERRPDVIVLGRESFVWHLPRLGAAPGTPVVVLAQGGTTAGIAAGSYPRDRATTLLERIRRADRVIAVAAHLRETLRGLGVDRTVYVPNAVDLSLFAPAGRDPRLAGELGVADGDVVVLHASNLKRVKRPLDLVESARIALAAAPRLLYVVVGEGPLREKTEQAAAEAGVRDRFRFVPWVEHEQMPRYVNLAHLVAMPSETEAQALVYLETMACAGTLLTTDIPAAREIAADGESAVFFPTGDVAALAARTVELARDPGLRRAIGRRALERVQPHALDTVVTGYERVLCDVVERATAGGRPPPEPRLLPARES